MSVFSSVAHQAGFLLSKVPLLDKVPIVGQAASYVRDGANFVGRGERQSSMRSIPPSMQFPRTGYGNTVQPSDSVAALRDEFSDLLAKLRADVGNTIQRVGSGVTDAAASGVSGKSNNVTIPTNQTTLFLISLLVVGGLVTVILVMRSRN